MYYWYDDFCKVYWNRVTQEWQQYNTTACRYSTKREAEEDSFYIYDMENVKLKLNGSNLAFAA